MSHRYRAIGWNAQKKAYDLALLAGVAVYLAVFIGGSAWIHPTATAETLLIRGFGSAAFLLLTLVLCIGPLCRLDRRFLPLLYNRRHLGVTTFVLALAHGGLSLFQFHALGRVSPLVSLFTANQAFGSLADFPFQPLGFFALLILFAMAATSHDFWLANLTPPIWKSLHMSVYAAYALLVAHVTLGLLQTERSPILAGAMAAGMVTVLGLHLASALREARIDGSQAASGSDGLVLVGEVGSIPEKRAVVVSVRGERIAVFRYDGRISALSNVCRHQNGPLGEGRIIDGCVTCPWHGYQYRPGDGASPPPFTEKVSTFRTKVSGGRVWVDPTPLPPGTPVEPSLLPARAPPPDDEFYVGYLPAAPARLRRRLRWIVGGLVTGAALLGVAFAAAQREFADSRFEFGQVRQYHGVLRPLPFPTLTLDEAPPGREGGKSFLLVAPGKHGLADSFGPLPAGRVTLAGTLIARAEGMMLEVVPGSLSPESTDRPAAAGTVEDLGIRELSGEVVDTKCFLGVMNPGAGKVHRECAVNCLRGGIPPALFTSDLGGAPKVLLLTDPDGNRLSMDDYLPFAGLTVRARGRVVRDGELWTLRTSGPQIRKLP